VPIVNFGLDLSLDLTYLSVFGYLGYVVIGYILGNYVFGKNKIFLLFLLFIMFIGSTFLIVILTYIYSKENNILETFFYDNFSLLVLIQAISIFLIIKDKTVNIINNKNIYNFITLISPLVFGIYLIHPIFLRALKRIDILHFDCAIIDIIVLSSLTFLLSALIVIVMKKIPYLNKMVP
jgi:surface polysaccharide O-acyltransferase-like enzyme